MSIRCQIGVKSVSDRCQIGVRSQGTWKVVPSLRPVLDSGLSCIGIGSPGHVCIRAISDPCRIVSCLGHGAVHRHRRAVDRAHYSPACYHAENRAPHCKIKQNKSGWRCLLHDVVVRVVSHGKADEEHVGGHQCGLCHAPSFNGSAGPDI